jgi:dihydrodipicolinate synthase/N-acetylneuraminate lyase
MKTSEINAKRRFGRKIIGMAAVLLPFTEKGDIAEDAFASCLEHTVNAGLTPAVNMDTGYANLISEEEKTRILRLTQATLGGKPYVAGAYIEGKGGEGKDGDIGDLYKREVAHIAAHGGTPILFQTSRLHNVPASVVVDAYNRGTSEVPTAYAFELSKVFAPNGEIWPDETFQGILEIPQIKGMKHSSLDRLRELERLAVRDSIRPDFAIFTGNDLGIDMIEYGSDYLLGLATFCPEKFAERDRLWEAQDPAYYALSDALQLLGNIGFRNPVPAYKHSAAVFLHLLGRIPSDKTHPRSAERPAWEREIMQTCAERLGY